MKYPNGSFMSLVFGLPLALLLFAGCSTIGHLQRKNSEMRLTYVKSINGEPVSVGVSYAKLGDRTVVKEYVVNFGQYPNMVSVTSSNADANRDGIPDADFMTVMCRKESGDGFIQMEVSDPLSPRVYGRFRECDTPSVLETKKNAENLIREAMNSSQHK